MASDTDTLVWRVIQGFEDYEVSETGAVRRRTPHKKKTFGTGYMVRLRLNQDGYVTCVLWTGRQQKTLLVHRLVCAAFCGPQPPARPMAAHKNGVRDDNRAANLRWASASENKADTLLHGTMVRGERHGRAKINTDDVRAIRAAHVERGGYDDLAARFGISASTVKKIRRGEIWTHVTTP